MLGGSERRARGARPMPARYHLVRSSDQRCASKPSGACSRLADAAARPRPLGAGGPLFAVRSRALVLCVLGGFVSFNVEVN